MAIELNTGTAEYTALLQAADLTFNQSRLSGGSTDVPYITPSGYTNWEFYPQTNQVDTWAQTFQCMRCGERAGDTYVRPIREVECLFDEESHMFVWIERLYHKFTCEHCDHLEDHEIVRKEEPEYHYTIKYTYDTVTGDTIINMDDPTWITVSPNEGEWSIATPL